MQDNAPRTDESISEIRKRAWETRRQKYGKYGHAGSYSRQAGACPHCARMGGLIVRLLAEGTLSEGQAAKATGLDRITLRKMVDDLINSGAVREPYNAPAAAKEVEGRE